MFQSLYKGAIVPESTTVFRHPRRDQLGRVKFAQSLQEFMVISIPDFMEANIVVAYIPYNFVENHLYVK